MWRSRSSATPTTSIPWSQNSSATGCWRPARRTPTPTLPRGGRGPLARWLDLAVQVRAGDHGHELIDRILWAGDWPRPVGARRDASLDGLPGRPLLLVGGVAELQRIRGVKARLADHLGRPEQLAFDAPPVRGGRC